MSLSGRWVVLLILGVMISTGAGMAENALLPEHAASVIPTLADGVRAYREGDYAGASRVLEALHRKTPQDTRTTYYLAMTEARQGNYREAAKLYEDILKREPDGQAAKLAREGLRYLPTEKTEWDEPPRFGDESAGTATPSEGNKKPAAGMPPLSPASAQDWMAWQWMMGQTGRNNSGWGNMMMPPGNNGQPNTGETPDPGMMSDMLMEQMMQNFTLSGDKDENR